MAKEANLTTDESCLYVAGGKEFASHNTVLHGAGIYVCGDVTTNTVEGFFSIFKRGTRRIYQHCNEKNPHHCLCPVRLPLQQPRGARLRRCNRADAMLKGIVGKRLAAALCP